MKQLKILSKSQSSVAKIRRKNYFIDPDLNIRPADLESHALASAPKLLGSELVAQPMPDAPVLLFLIISNHIMFVESCAFKKEDFFKIA